MPNKSLLIYLFCLVLAPTLSRAADSSTPTPIDDVEPQLKSEAPSLPLPEPELPPLPDEPQLTRPSNKKAETTVTPQAPPSRSTRTVPKESSESGEKIFDWRQHEGETTVKHPFAEKGLVRISRDGTYWYKVKESQSDRAMTFQAGPINPVNLRNPDADAGETHATFADNYDQTTNPAFMISKEWEIWKGPLGKLGFRLGSGAFVAQGHGHFAGKVNQDKVPLEVFTFIAMPNTVGAVYRMQFSRRPLFVPYLEGGGIGFTFMEVRDDNKPPKFGVSPAAYGAGGMALNLTYFDYLSRIQLDHEYGITAVYLTLEYRRIQAIVTRFDFSSDYFNGGFLMEY